MDININSFIFSGKDLFVDYNNQQTEAHLWIDPLQKIKDNNDLLWNLEIFPNGRNLQVLKLKKTNNGNYVEVLRDPKLNINLETITNIIQTIKDKEE